MLQTVLAVWLLISEISMPNQFADPSNVQGQSGADAMKIVQPGANTAAPQSSTPQNIENQSQQPPDQFKLSEVKVPDFSSKTDVSLSSFTNPEAAQHESGDQPNISSYEGAKVFQGANISVPAFTDSQSANIGANLESYTANHANVRYDFGSKNSATGGIDCSGWVSENTLNAMKSMNQHYGKPIYDVEKMQSVMSQGAAYQIDSIGKMTGYTPESELRAGHVENGMLIGVQRNNIPSWAADRPNGISHIGQVVIKSDGSKWVSESSGSGVKMTPYDQFINKPTVHHIYGVNPFHILSTTYMATQK